MERSEAIEKIIQFFGDNDEVFNACIVELNSYNGFLGDNVVYPMDYIDELYYHTNPSDILARAFYGYDADNWTTTANGEKEYAQFNPNREFFYYNGYGNLVSTDYMDYSDYLDDYFVQELENNRAHIWTIQEDSELSSLFDDLEEAEA